CKIRRRSGTERRRNRAGDSQAGQATPGFHRKFRKRRPHGTSRKRKRRVVDPERVSATGDERGRGGESGAGNDRRDRSYVEGADGRGDETVASKSRRSRGRQNAER